MAAFFTIIVDLGGTAVSPINLLSHQKTQLVNPQKKTRGGTVD